MNLRICTRNIYDECQLDKNIADLTTKYTPSSVTSIRNTAERSKSSIRGLKTQSFIQSSFYALQGSISPGVDIKVLGFSGLILPKRSYIRLFMWNDTDWGALGVSESDTWIGNDVGGPTYSALITITDTSVKFPELINDYGNTGDFKPSGATPAVKEDSVLFWYDDPRVDVTYENTGTGSSFPTNITHWKLVVSDLDNTNIRYESGRVWMGDFREVAYTVAPGHTLTVQDNNKPTVTQDGSTFNSSSSTRKELKANLSVVSSNDAGYFREAALKLGTFGDIAVSVFPQNSDALKELDYTFIGKFKKAPMVSGLTGDSFYKVSLSVTD